MIKEMLLIAIVAIGLLLIPGLNSKANAIPITSVHPTGIGIGLLLAFKAHKDNPTQEPIIIHPNVILHILKHQLPHIDIDKR